MQPMIEDDQNSLNKVINAGKTFLKLLVANVDVTMASFSCMPLELGQRQAWPPLLHTVPLERLAFVASQQVEMPTSEAVPLPLSLAPDWAQGLLQASSPPPPAAAALLGIPLTPLPGSSPALSAAAGALALPTDNFCLTYGQGQQSFSRKMI